MGVVVFYFRIFIILIFGFIDGGFIGFITVDCFCEECTVCFSHFDKILHFHVDSSYNVITVKCNMLIRVLHYARRW